MSQQILPQGTVLTERFEIEALAGKGDLGLVYKAMDKKTNQTVALRVIPKSVFKDEDEVNALRERVRETSTLYHRNIRGIFGMGVHEDSLICLAAEWVDGQNLRDLLNKRKQEDKRFSFQGAYNIMGHVCNALSHAHGSTYHGTMSPRAIMVSNSGRVKVCDFGLSILRAQVNDYAGRDKVEAAFWAPEILGRKKLDTPASADIFSLGALFYELITGEPPIRPLKAPSHYGFAKDVDQVIARCMGSDPAQRFPDAGAVKAAIAELVKIHAYDEEEQTSTDDDLGINIEIDLDGMQATSPKSGAASNGPMSTFNAGAGDGKGGGSMLDAPGLPPPPSQNRRDEMNDGRVSTIDMGEVLSGLSNTESARWMVQKDKFDHGPFTDRELVQMIMLGDILGKHQLLNMDTGVRKKVRAWGDFDEYLERYRLKKKQQEEEMAKVRTEKAEARGTMARWLIVLIVLGVIGLATGGYLLTRTLRQEKTYTPEEMVAALDSGEIKLKTGGNLIRKKGRRGGKGGRRKGGGGGGGTFVDGMSYEDAMNMGVQLGSLANNAGQRQLSPRDITNIMDRNVRRFLPCVAGKNVKKVEMNIAISGDGRVMGISVAQGDAGLKKCVASKVRAIKFPTSAAPRTAASWYFELY